MSGFHNQRPSAGSLYSIEHTTEEMDYDMNQTLYANGQHLHNAHAQMQRSMYEHSPTDYTPQYNNQWPEMNMTHQHVVRQQQHLSALSYLSGSSGYRSSANSVFSHDPLRDSTFSASSFASDFSKEQHISDTEYMLTRGSSAQSSYAPSPISPIEGPISASPIAPRKRTSQRQQPQVKDFFKTCVSGTKQCRPSKNEPKYFCTICEKKFGEKADWKRHEETYQERPEMFQCDLCPAVYFLDRDFALHHVNGHRCASCEKNTRCIEKRHVQDARKQRTTRTGWGCGFCCYFTTSWTERCNHIAQHIERKGKKPADWRHSCVIQSLLQRPEIYVEWQRILASKRRRFTSIAWNQHSTGRVEGYPVSNQTLQLQDALEYFTPGQDAAALAQFAYDKAIKQAELPEVPVEPPLPPPKDYHDHHATMLQDMVDDAESWAQFARSVREDPVLPSGVCHIDGRYFG